MIAPNSHWHMIAQSDAITWTVLFILLVMSIVCWFVFIIKLIPFLIKRKQLATVLTQLKDVDSVEKLVIVARQHQSTLPGDFLSKNLNFLHSLLSSRKENTPKSVQYDIERMHYHIEQTLDSIVTRQESYMSILSVSAAVAPLLGLLGTVWGLINSFLSIGQKQSADITAVAPGIAQALMTTFAGLIVAIPALVMYNFFMVQIRYVETQLVKIGDKIHFIAEHTLTK